MQSVLTAMGTCCFASVTDRQTQGQTGRLTDSMRITDGRTDARWYSGYVVRHWTGMASNGTPLRHTHGQLPHATVRAEQRQTDALLSAGKMLHPCTHTQKNTHTHTHAHALSALLVPFYSPPVCSLLSESQTGGDVCSLRHCHLLFFSPPHSCLLPSPLLSSPLFSFAFLCGIYC